MSRPTKERSLARWGVVKIPTGHRIALGDKPLLLGCGWMPGNHWHDVGAIRWPAAFQTRRQARSMAKLLIQKYDYLKPSMDWQFRAVAVQIAVSWTR